VNSVRRLRPELWLEQTWLLHHDKAPSHTSFLTQQFLSKNKMAVIPHPLYSPDLAPCEFFLFPKIKLKLKGRRFDKNEEIQPKSQRVLDTLTGEDFQEAFQKWRRRFTCGRELRRGWWRPIGLMVSFFIFTAPVRNILDSPSYLQEINHVLSKHYNCELHSPNCSLFTQSSLSLLTRTSM
jgi:hypothetical protein